MRQWIVTLASLILGGGAFAQAPKPLYYERAAVVAFGIDQYAQANFWKPSAGCALDAERICQVLADRFKYEPRIKLLTEQATRHAMMTAIEQAAAAAKPEDVLVLFFAMHGHVVDFGTATAPRRQGYFIAYDSNIDPTTKTEADWNRQALSMSWVLDVTRKSAAKHVLIIADTCCSGFLTERGRLFQESSLRALMTRSSRRVLAATSSQGKTTAYGGESGGLFTKELVKALSEATSAEGTIEVFLKARKAVIASSQSKMIPQCESFAPSDGELIFLPDDPETQRDLARLMARLKTDQPTPDQLVGLGRGFSAIQARLQARTKLADVIAAYEAEDYRFSLTPLEGHKLWKERFENFEQNAIAEQALAMLGLVYCYAKGLGTERDGKQAYYWACEAAKQNDPAGRHALGKCFDEGLGTVANPLAAREEFRQAANASFPISLFVRGLERRAAGQAQQAEQDLQAAAKAGVNRARAALARTRILDRPKSWKELTDIEQFIQTSPTWFESSELQFVLALCLAQQAEWLRNNPQIAEKLGVRLPDVLARLEKHLRTSANAGRAEAQFNLALELFPLSYTYEVDVSRWLTLPSDVALADSYCELAARQKSPAAQVLMASRTELTDPKQAEKYLAEPLAKGHASALLVSSMWSNMGRGNRKVDLEHCVTELKASLAAEPTHPGARRWLGVLLTDAHQNANNNTARFLAKHILQPADFVQNQPVFGHLALRHLDYASRVMPKDDIAATALDELLAEAKANPQAPFWLIYQQRSPQDAARLKLRMMALK